MSSRDIHTSSMYTGIHVPYWLDYAPSSKVRPLSSLGGEVRQAFYPVPCNLGISPPFLGSPMSMPANRKLFIQWFACSLGKLLFWPLEVMPTCMVEHEVDKPCVNTLSQTNFLTLAELRLSLHAYMPVDSCCCRHSLSMG